MAFTQFNNSGYRDLCARIKAALAELGDELKLDFEPGGGSLGTNEMTIKVRCKTRDTKALEAAAKQNFGWAASRYGLEADDFGLEFSWGGGRYRLNGIKTNRPKYPFEAVCLRTGRQYKMPHSIVPAVAQARNERDLVKAAAARSLTAQPKSGSVEQGDDRYAATAVWS